MVFVDETAENVPTLDPGNSAVVTVGPLRWSQVQTAVRALRVVVGHIDTQHSFGVATAQDQYLIEALGAHGSDPALRVRVRSRVPDGRRDDSRSFGAEDIVEGCGDLGIPIPDQESEPAVRVGQITGEVPGHLGGPGPGGMLGNTDQVDSAAGQLDDEQHVELPEQHRVHREEVGGHDPGGLGFEELSPRRSSPGRGPKTMAAQDPTDRRRRHPDPELSELALDAHASPAAVLSAQPDDELDRPGGQGRSARSALSAPPAPLPSRGVTVPAQQRVRSDQERLPVGGGQAAC